MVSFWMASAALFKSDVGESVNFPIEVLEKQVWYFKESSNSFISESFE